MSKPRLDTDPNNSRAVKFAERMNRIPRRALRCEIYGTVSVALDERHAANIIRKVFPCATQSEIYAAMTVLHNRIDAA